MQEPRYTSAKAQQDSTQSRKKLKLNSSSFFVEYAGGVHIFILLIRKVWLVTLRHET